MSSDLTERPQIFLPLKLFSVFQSDEQECLEDDTQSVTASSITVSGFCAAHNTDHLKSPSFILVFTIICLFHKYDFHNQVKPIGPTIPLLRVSYAIRNSPCSLKTMYLK